MAAKFPAIEKKEKKAAELPDASEVRVRKEIKDGLSVETLANNDLSDDFEFNGFNPEDTVEEISKRLKGTTPADSQQFLNAGVQFVAMRGTQASNKVRSSMKQQGQTILQATVTALGIVPTPVDRKSVTFARFGNVMAVSVQRVLVMDKGNKFAGRIVAEDFRPQGFCRAFCIPNFPSLIPFKVNTRKCLMNGYKIWVWKFSRTIRPTVAPNRAGAGGVVLPDDPNFTGQRVPEIDPGNKTFIDAMMQSKFFSEEQKLAAMEEMVVAWLKAKHVSPFDKAAAALYCPFAVLHIDGALAGVREYRDAGEGKGTAAELVTAIGVDRARILPRESLEAILTDALTAGGEGNKTFYRCIRALASLPLTAPTAEVGDKKST